MEPTVLWALVASAFVAAVCYYAVFLSTGVVFSSREIYRSSTVSRTFDEKQTADIRKKDFAFRNFETLIQEIRKFYKKPEILRKIDHYLDILDMAPPWNAASYLATRQAEAWILGVLATVIALAPAGKFAPVIGLLVGGAYYVVMTGSLKSEALARKDEIVRRLPFIVDLMALIRLANGSFSESLQIVATENAGHPAGEVFQRTYLDFKYGKTKNDVMDELARRMQDPSFEEIAFVIVKADELGRPVAETLAELAGQMRLKRYQWGEKASGEAQVKIVFPGILIMCACMLVMVAPFVLLGVGEEGVGLI